MAAKRSYSRYFIILQEDEKGYSTDSNKFPTGYAKVERKNDKCRVSYYVQNLKRTKDSYYMMLICDRKNDKRLIKLGKINIDNYGRADVSYEYDANNVANCNVPMDTIKGAAIVTMDGSTIHGVLTGFVSGTKLDDWKSYAVIENKERMENKKPESAEKKEIKDNKNDVKISESPKEEADIKREKNIFDEYEKNIEAAKNIIIEENEEKDSSYVEQPREEEKQDKKENSEEKEERSKEYEVEVNTIQEDKTEKDRAQEPEIYDAQIVNVEAEDREIKSVEAEGREIEEGEVKGEISLKESEAQRQDEQAEKGEVKIKDKLEEHADLERKGENKEDNEDYPIGKVGKFFKSMASGLEELKNICPEVGKCRWYKISCKEFMNANPSKDFNKYTTLYYPMNSCYPYIRRKGHYLVGYKCDKDGNMKYLVYAIPGSKSIYDQPFGGATGFVTWVSKNKNNDREDREGYWVMFYDFRNSTIVVPVKR